ncbi:hypothetical protein KY290_037447 [Solanum tuberosum]|uniref:Reverse transcriptase zinc-binding domain-containing protein n=1 Tax=Solanum tuberosum TaxID=4113 RepID=A0ABQ7TVJ7_SOLTU|nr:hypothetical protein KY290_037447 [Solanum tuberosum]
MKQFSIKQIYLRLRGDFQKVEWRRLVCNNLGAPRWIFILRLAVLNKFYTRDRLLKWGMVVNPSCPLCSMADESHLHLFFACTVSAQIWQKTINWLGISRSRATANATYKSSRAEVYRMVLEATI